MSTRARIAKRGRTESEGSGAELSGVEPGQRLVGGERSEPGGRAQRGVANRCAPLAGGRPGGWSMLRSTVRECGRRSASCRARAGWRTG
jgi:hypothetical protein